MQTVPHGDDGREWEFLDCNVDWKLVSAIACKFTLLVTLRLLMLFQCLLSLASPSAPTVPISLLVSQALAGVTSELIQSGV